jgi:hypothetical protein
MDFLSFFYKNFIYTNIFWLNLEQICYNNNVGGVINFEPPIKRLKMDIYENLSTIRHNLFLKAERLWLYSLALSIIILLVSIVIIMIDNPTVLILGSGLIFFGQIIALFLKESSNKAQETADKCRRVILYSNGFGTDIRKEDYAIAKTWVKFQDGMKSVYVKPYYASNRPPGPNRLAEIMSEAAYFTYCLSDSTAGILNIILALAGIIVATMIYVAFFAQLNQNTLAIIGKTVMVLVGFFFVSDVFSIKRKYQKMSEVALRTFSELSRMSKNGELREFEVMQVVEDYNIELVQTPPTPSMLYNRDKDKINNAYRQALIEDTNG